MTIIFKVFLIIMMWAAVSGSFYFSRLYVLDTRLKKDSKASPFEIIVTFLLSAIMASALAYIGGGQKEKFDTDPTTIAIFIVLTLSSFLGLWVAYEKDAKMTTEEKFQRRVKSETDKLTQKVTADDI